jgi:hypothetical protein
MGCTLLRRPAEPQHNCRRHYRWHPRRRYRCSGCSQSRCRRRYRRCHWRWHRRGRWSERTQLRLSSRLRCGAGCARVRLCRTLLGTRSLVGAWLVSSLVLGRRTLGLLSVPLLVLVASRLLASRLALASVALRLSPLVRGRRSSYFEAASYVRRSRKRGHEMHLQDLRAAMPTTPPGSIVYSDARLPGARPGRKHRARGDDSPQQWQLDWLSPSLHGNVPTMDVNVPGLRVRELKFPQRSAEIRCQEQYFLQG